LNIHTTPEELRQAVLDALAAHAPSPWLDADAAAAYISCTRGTLKTWRSRGEGPRYRVINGKLVRYHRDDLDAYVRGEAAND
jgi:excisionase family DNA binding protein